MWPQSQSLDFVLSEDTHDTDRLDPPRLDK
jgi:hypothetical protein